MFFPLFYLSSTIAQHGKNSKMSSVVSIHIQNIRLTCQIHLNKRRTFSYTILTHRPFSPVYILSSHKNHLIRSLSQSKYLYLYPHKTKNHAQTFAHTIFSPHFVGMFPSNPFSFCFMPKKYPYAPFLCWTNCR